MSPALNHGLAAILLIGLIAIAPPAIALIVGAGYALVLGREGLTFNVSATSKWCLQTAIVLLGFNIAIAEVARTGSLYFAVGAAYIGIAVLLGVTLARLFFISSTDRTLITSGTAICGGTAIGSVAPLIGAKAEETACALGIVFLLNLVALIAFPWLGEQIGLSQSQFGVWAALAIHDTSSVVGAAQTYGVEAAQTATVVKLSRTLWLIPLVLWIGLRSSNQGRVQVPYFVLFFIGSSILGSAGEWPQLLHSAIDQTSDALLIAALFLIGIQIDRNALRAMSGRVIGYATSLWLILIPTALVIAMLIEQ